MRSHVALMGLRIGQQSASGTLIHRLHGLAFESQALENLPANELSPYEGLTVEEARAFLSEEREEIQQLVERMPPGEEILSLDPALLSRYSDRIRLLGEAEAITWLLRELGEE